MSRHIPNFLTLSNLFFGCCALVFSLNHETVVAAWFVLGCFVCDYADGMTARARWELRPRSANNSTLWPTW
ncbi:MAG: CDP-alcohol phosphatidyltransferase family protein [Lewinellaceae bacterium]|nr:CDP-alcohol phosphatidyltransferase family protein [Lewinellaceae bacterium]